MWLCNSLSSSPWASVWLPAESGDTQVIWAPPSQKAFASFGSLGGNMEGKLVYWACHYFGINPTIIWLNGLDVLLMPESVGRFSCCHGFPPQKKGSSVRTAYWDPVRRTCYNTKGWHTQGRTSKVRLPFAFSGSTQLLPNEWCYTIMLKSMNCSSIWTSGLNLEL